MSPPAIRNRRALIGLLNLSESPLGSAGGPLVRGPSEKGLIKPLLMD